MPYPRPLTVPQTAAHPGLERVRGGGYGWLRGGWLAGDICLSRDNLQTDVCLY